MPPYDWDTLAERWSAEPAQELWRNHSDTVNRRLLEHWIGDASVEKILKTDLFDEAFGEGVTDWLAARAREVYGIDVSDAVVRFAGRGRPGLRATCADVRCLPFRDDEFDVVVSISTLDHFEERSDIDRGIRELLRVLKPGGKLVLTLDNGLNPVVALRNALPLRPLEKASLVPYFVGPTYGPRGLTRALDAAGFEIVERTATLHCPRVLAIPLAAKLHDRGSGLREAFARVLLRFETLAVLPTRFVTGHYVAVLARKPQRR